LRECCGAPPLDSDKKKSLSYVKQKKRKESFFLIGSLGVDLVYRGCRHRLFVLFFFFWFLCAGQGPSLNESIVEIRQFVSDA